MLMLLVNRKATSNKVATHTATTSPLSEPRMSKEKIVEVGHVVGQHDEKRDRQPVPSHEDVADVEEVPVERLEKKQRRNTEIHGECDDGGQFG